MAETTAATVQDEVLSYYDEWLRRFSERLVGLSEDEYLWEPVPGSWSVRPTPEGPQVDRLEPEPDPARSPRSRSLPALPSLNTNVAVQGPGANLLTVRRNTGGSYRLFNISANNVIISGLTIANGNSPSNGGGISSTGGLTIANCTISGHTTGSSGGGIVSSRTLSIVNSTISGNSATGGFGGGIYSTGTAQITNSTISNNSVSEPSLASVAVAASKTVAVR